MIDTCIGKKMDQWLTFDKDWFSLINYTILYMLFIVILIYEF